MRSGVWSASRNLHLYSRGANERAAAAEEDLDGGGVVVVRHPSFFAQRLTSPSSQSEGSHIRCLRFYVHAQEADKSNS